MFQLGRRGTVRPRTLRHMVAEVAQAPGDRLAGQVQEREEMKQQIRTELQRLRLAKRKAAEVPAEGISRGPT